jgi:uncharacterized protein with HEPN domain
MFPDRKSDAATLSDVVAACSRVMEFVRGARRSDLDRNPLMLSGCCYQMAVIGEAVIFGARFRRCEGLDIR